VGVFVIVKAMSLAALPLFTIVWIIIVYALNCAIARQWLRLELRPVLFYVAMLAGLGVLGEILIDTGYNLVFGQPLWEYRLLPIHHAYTSVYSLLLWGAVGFHMYLLHGTLQKRGITSLHKLALVFGLEAIFYEAVVNLSYLALFHRYIYYYLPTDLWHITSVQALPLYCLAGFGTVTILRFAMRLPRSATLGSATLALVLVGVGWFLAG
jgi:hypothetical protein